MVAEVTISPASLFLGVLKPGQKITKQLVVQGKKPFKITAVKCDAEGFEFKTSDAAKTVHVIPVTFTAGEKAVKFSQANQDRERSRAGRDPGDPGLCPGAGSRADQSGR